MIPWDSWKLPRAFLRFPKGGGVGFFKFSVPEAPRRQIFKYA